MTSLYAFKATSIEGREVDFEQYRGKTLLIVNVASQCGFTPQYAGLEALYEGFRDRGLVVLGFPCDQFGHQEPGSGETIKQFCTVTYGVRFPLFAKIRVNGKKTHPLYQYLKKQSPGLLGSTVIKWNFTKFLVDAEGMARHRYAPTVIPEHIGHDLLSIFSAC